MDDFVFHDFWPLEFVVPMLIPVSKDLGVPLILDLLFAEVKEEIFLFSGFSGFSFLDQERPNVIDPFGSDLRISGFEIKASFVGND